MSIFPEYQVGGSLASEHHTYVTRKADHEFYENLKRGKFCYVLNSRQMGKSSLRVRTMQKLQEDKIVCIGIDISSLCETNVTQEDWYGGLLNKLARELNKDFPLRDWWERNKHVTPLQRLSIFIETEVIKILTQESLVIFIDEIDRLIDLPFKEDFFVFIRECYNNRAANKNYNRLTFALLGVATPSDLITNSSLTPFNIDSKAIELTGFNLEEAEPLQKVLEGKVKNPKIIIECILKWTGGQPFLTQRLCQIILTKHSEISNTEENVFVEKLVRSQIIENWITQDEKSHFKTISDRLTKSKNSSKLLKLYQKILQESEVLADDSKEQLEIRLSGLVVRQEGKLKVYNPIYKSVFDENWVKMQLKERNSIIESVHKNRIIQELLEGKFYYVLSSPINEKEKFLEEITSNLSLNEISSAIINSKIHRHKDAKNFEWNTRGEWYLNLATEISKGFKLDINLLKKLWIMEKKHYGNVFPGCELLHNCLEKLLLEQEIEEKLVIIFDSIAYSSHNLEKIKPDNNQEEYQHLFDDLVFQDEVFNFIYSCYEKRRINPNYNRLIFLLLDIAIHPNEHIELESNTISVGWAVDFENSDQQEVRTFILDDDAKQKVAKFDYHEILKSIWYWTNGHPFVTQKLIELFLKEKHKIIHGQERNFVENLVEEQFIQKIKIPDTSS